jgi:tyrosyl-tRNA synthetase
MSKSLDNYIGINEPPYNIFRKIMTISDDLMWDYWELTTDLHPDDIKQMHDDVTTGIKHPMDVKMWLASRIVSDFHSAEDAKKAETKFNEEVRHKLSPDDVEERQVFTVVWKLPRLLVEIGFASSMKEARRLIEGGGVYVDGERRTNADYEVHLMNNRKPIIKVGHRFMRVFYL